MKQQGITLIELMVVVAIFGLLALAGLSFTGNWVNSNRVFDGENLLTQAFNYGKAASLRNEDGVTADTPATIICSQNNELSVRGIDSSEDEANCTSDNVIWKSAVHERISITDNDVSFSCACLNNRGRLTKQGTACTACSTGLSYEITSGGESETLTLN